MAHMQKIGSCLDLSSFQCALNWSEKSLVATVALAFASEIAKQLQKIWMDVNKLMQVFITYELVSRGQTAFFRFSLWWRKKGHHKEKRKKSVHHKEKRKKAVWLRETNYESRYTQKSYDLWTRMLPCIMHHVIWLRRSGDQGAHVRREIVMTGRQRRVKGRKPLEILIRRKLMPPWLWVF